MQTESTAIDTLFLEERRYPPPEEFAAQANAQARHLRRSFEEFWEREAKERVTWFEPFTKLYEWEPPYAKWYLGGKLNVSLQLRRPARRGRPGDKVAFHWEGEPEGDTRDDHVRGSAAEVVAFANALKELGVQKGTAGRRSTWAWSPSCRSRCSPARGSARRTPSCSAASPPTRSPAA